MLIFSAKLEKMFNKIDKAMENLHADQDKLNDFVYGIKPYLIVEQRKHFKSILERYAMHIQKMDDLIADLENLL